MKWFWKICSRSGRSTNNLKRNGQKQFKKKLLISVSISRKVGQIKGRALTGGFVVFTLLVVLSIIKLYTPDISLLDICKFLVTGILICEMLFFVKWKSQDFCVLCFTSPVKLLRLSLEWFFSVKQSGKLPSKVIY